LYNSISYILIEAKLLIDKHVAVTVGCGVGGAKVGIGVGFFVGRDVG